MYVKPAIVAGILGTIATVGWTLQGVGLAYFYWKVCSFLVEGGFRTNAR